MTIINRPRITCGDCRVTFTTYWQFVAHNCEEERRYHEAERKAPGKEASGG